MSDTADSILAVFEDFGTAQVLMTPSTREKQIATKAVDEELAVDLIVRDLAIVAAREVANVLERYAMRAADYADTPEMWQNALKKITNALRDREAFASTFQEHLQARG